jgi:four helix bundle protein
MATELEDLKVLRTAEQIADNIWSRVSKWDDFPRDVLGKQLARAADSIGANIAESFGRFNYGEKIQFLYYSRGSLFETKYWLNRAKSRQLIHLEDIQIYASELTNLARQLNSFAASLKAQKSNSRPNATLREESSDYVTNNHDGNNMPFTLFAITDLAWLDS